MSTTEALPAIEKTVVVDASIETAFETFTRRLASWWPLETHSIHKDRIAEMVFEEREGGRLYERTATGEEADWADVVAWEPPHRIVLRWRVNPERPATEVEVRFTPDGKRTRVDLEHRNLERHGAGWESMRAAVASPDGWALEMRRFADFVAGRPLDR